MKYNIETCNKNDEDIIIDNLVKYNLSKVKSAQEQDFIYINRKICNQQGRIIAGILAKMYCWNCMYIDVLWVDEEYRKQGLGKSLLREAEKIAKDKGCYMAHLDTFDFQAKDFYSKYGYRLFGTLEGCPKNHNRYFLTKKL